MKKNMLACLLMLMTLAITSLKAADNLTFEAKVNSLVADNNFISTYTTILTYASKSDMPAYWAEIKAKNSATWTKTDKERIVKYLGYKDVNEMKEVAGELKSKIEGLNKNHPELLSSEHKNLVNAALKKSVKIGKLKLSTSTQEQAKPDCFTQWLMDNAFCSAALLDTEDHDFYSWCIMAADAHLFLCDNL